MIPRDVHLTYLERNFVKLPLDITPAQGGDIGEMVEVSTDIEELLEFVGQQPLAPVGMMELVAQAAQKAATVYYRGAERPHDIADCRLLLQNIANKNDALIRRFGELISQELQARQVPKPYAVQNKPGLISSFVEAGYGSENECISVLDTIEQSLSTFESTSRQN
ncbi:hypothetical protein KIM372_01190 [Bombiscardovia nodaiensis]|uniref:Uncharacterized protein n=1 Tax=Bombiscardovia nodaiensis TaxID=2932181 RepID=A0ABN6S7S1_9BIFI|nr:hypothetical protein KIM372_01190 [Bombiscardovia nodaiensis]